MDKRMARVQISYGLIEELLHGSLRAAHSSLPADAKVIDVGANWEDHNRQTFWVVLESESFGIVPDGVPMPTIEITYEDKPL